MQFSDDDLRTALKRKDPGPDFTARVMARLNDAGARKISTAPEPHSPFAWLNAFRFGPALAAAAVALMLLVGAWIGYQSYQQHEKEARIRQEQQELAEKKAQQQVMLALRISSEKLNHVFQKVNSALPQDANVRR